MRCYCCNNRITPETYCRISYSNIVYMLCEKKSCIDRIQISLTRKMMMDRISNCSDDEIKKLATLDVLRHGKVPKSYSLPKVQYVNLELKRK